jgi:hypothetical protein
MFRSKLAVVFTVSREELSAFMLVSTLNSMPLLIEALSLRRVIAVQCYSRICSLLVHFVVKTL